MCVDCLTLYFYSSPNLSHLITSSHIKQEVSCSSDITTTLVQSNSALGLVETHFHQLFHLEIFRVVKCVLLNPCFGLSIKALNVRFVLIGDHSILRIVGLRCTEQSL